jgi:CRISPR-associated protein Csm5
MIKPFMKTTRCTVSTLSPVHIGCGEDYYPTNYVIDDGLLHHFSEEGLLAALSPSEKNALAKIAEKPNDRNDSGIKELQQFIHSKKDTLQLYATHSVPLSKELEKFYQSRIGKTSQREANGRNVNNQLNIARHAFNPYNQTPYFAGSSIKGAIRTALLNALNGNESLQSKLNELRITDKNRRPFIVNDKIDIPKIVNGKLQENLLDYQAISDKPEKGIKGDPLRLLKIGDATYKNSDDLIADEIRFAVNRKNKISKKQSELYQILECLPANRSRSLMFDMIFLADKAVNYRWTLSEICNACNEFFVPQLEKELDILQQLNYCNAEWAKNVEKLLANELGDAFKNQQAFLLRIGQHGGAESNTLEGLRHIKVKIKDKPAEYKYLPKPNTIWLAANHKDQQHDLLPFGWVIVEIDDFVLDKTHAFLTDQAAPDYARQATLQALAKQRAEFLTKKHIEQEEQAQKDAEAAEQQRREQQIQAEKAVQLANMTNSQRLIFELRQEYENAKPSTQPINGTLNPKLTAIINHAMDWSSNDKQSLFELGNEINKTLWNSNKKVRDRLKVLQT